MLYSDIRYACPFLSKRLGELVDKSIIRHSIVCTSEQYYQTIICLLNHLPSAHWNDIHNAVDHERTHNDFATGNGRQGKAVLHSSLNAFQYSKWQSTIV